MGKEVFGFSGRGNPLRSINEMIDSIASHLQNPKAFEILKDLAFKIRGPQQLHSVVSGILDRVETIYLEGGLCPLSDSSSSVNLFYVGEMSEIGSIMREVEGKIEDIFTAVGSEFYINVLDSEEVILTSGFEPAILSENIIRIFSEGPSSQVLDFEIEGLGDPQKNESIRSRIRGSNRMIPRHLRNSKKK